MKTPLPTFHVTTSTEGKVRVSQPLVIDGDVEISIIELNTNDIDQLIGQLQEAKSRARLDCAVDSLCASLPTTQQYEHDKLVPSHLAANDVYPQ